MGNQELHWILVSILKGVPNHILTNDYHNLVPSAGMYIRWQILQTFLFKHHMNQCVMEDTIFIFIRFSSLIFFLHCSCTDSMIKIIEGILFDLANSTFMNISYGTNSWYVKIYEKEVHFNIIVVTNANTINVQQEGKKSWHIYLQSYSSDIKVWIRRDIYNIN